MLVKKTMNLNDYKHYLKKPNKYSAKRTMIDGIHFHSKKEANYYCQLKLAQKSGELIKFEQQVSFEICKGRKYVVDFIEYWKDLTVNYIDVKGYDTPLSKLKRAIIEDKYGIKIELK
jgi:hypothetical protein